MIQFYAPSLKEDLALGREESLHCCRVLRKKAGDAIRVTDGKGNLYDCRITDANPKNVKLEILKKEAVKKNWKFDITLVVAPTKNSDRMAWLVEKSTEIGVDRIIFLQCRHSERKTVNVERLRRNAVSAMNQSLKAFLPEIKGPVDIKEILALKGEKFVGYCDSESERKIFVNEYDTSKDLVLAIGPEGDFTKDEIDCLKDAGFKAITFGDERLRTETAALYGLTAVHVINDLRQL